MNFNINDGKKGCTNGYFLEKEQSNLSKVPGAVQIGCKPPKHTRQICFACKACFISCKGIAEYTRHKKIKT